MPFPLGHAAIGFATNELCSKSDDRSRWWVEVLFIAIVSNLPDADVIVGLVLQGNGGAFHRGPTHSLVFAVCVGVIVANAWKMWSKIPVVSFTSCFLLCVSHIVSDAFLTNSPVSFLWPLDLHLSGGDFGWMVILRSAFLPSLQDAELTIGCGVVILLMRMVRQSFFVPGSVYSAVEEENVRLDEASALKVQTRRDET
jgi:membrane-bound metal-dependent hydrolase YbcI (DUF457 family)